MKRKSLLIISLFIVLFVFNCFNLSYDVKANSDVNYTFIDNVLYDDDSIEFDESFNFANETVFTEIYNGTYSFTNDNDGEFPLDWNSWDGTTTNEAFISSNYKKHSKVLTLENNTDVGLKQIIDPPDSSSVEFWVLKQSGLAGVVIEFYDNTDTNLTFMLVLDYQNCGLIREYEGEGNWETITDKYTDNVWIHLRIDFNDATHLLDVYVNGILEMEDNPYIDNVDFGLIRVRLGWSCGVSKCQFDAFGYSWDTDYNVNDNIVPYFYEIDKLIVKSDEFAFDENGENYELGVKDACGWEGNDVDNTYLVQDAQYTFDRRYIIHCEDTTIGKQILKYYDVNDGVFNFTLKINYLKMLNFGSSYWWYIQSTIDDIEAIIKFKHEAGGLRLYYCDDITLETYTLIGTLDSTYWMVRELTLFMGDICHFTYKDDYDFFEVYFPKGDKVDGLYSISFIGALDDTTLPQTIHIDNIGVFCNGTNLNNDFASCYLDLDVSIWHSWRYNIINLNALGIFSFSVYSDTDSVSLKEFYNYTNVKNWNIYDNFFYISDPSLIFITNSSISILSIKIRGVKMIDNGHSYIPRFCYDNVNIDESYFYVDSSNRLQFNLIANDNNTEYIELKFEGLDISTENISIQFKSDINGISVGFIRLQYFGYDSTHTYFPTYLKTTTVYLPQSRTIHTIGIVISDKNMTYYDKCDGYITNLKLLYSPSGFLPIDILFPDISALIVILIPLIIILAPTLTMSIKFGKNIILPMFIFMSLLCVITNLIPIWLFFIIALASGTLIFISYKRGVN